jgi:nucleoside 2-deoxyribosyltransferase
VASPAARLQQFVDGITPDSQAGNIAEVSAPAAALEGTDDLRSQSMSAWPSIYVASPLGFADSTREFINRVSGALHDRELECLDPWADPGGAVATAFAAANALPAVGERRAALASLDADIGRHNTDLLEQANGVFAVLDGPDVDSGTAAEVGFAAARGLPVVGYRSDSRQAGDNDGCVVNLQVEFFIKSSGGDIFRALEDGAERLAHLARAHQQQ